MSIDEVKPIEVLLVEDDPGDVVLITEAFEHNKVNNRLQVVADGVEALQYLRCEPPFEGCATPDLILLDLNLPRKDGREVLAEVKADDRLRRIPVVVLTTSQAEQDVLHSYNLNANCYISKPVDMNQFIAVVKSIENFWLTVVKL